METVVPYDQQIEPVRNAYKALNQTLADISDEQKQWNNTIRPNLHTILENLVKAGMKDWTVEWDQRLTNRQSLALVMPDTDSGIVHPVRLNPVEHARIGGRLIFSQLSNGHIEVSMQAPTIRNLTSSGPEKMKEVSGSELTNELVYKLVAEFIDKVNESVKYGM